MRIIVVCCVAALALVGIGCHGDSGSQDATALQVLASSQSSEEFGPAFWNDQSHKNTGLWQKAVAFCDQPANKLLVNCQTILVLAAPTVPYSTTMPPNSPRGGLNSVPSDQRQPH